MIACRIVIMRLSWECRFENFSSKLQILRKEQTKKAFFNGLVPDILGTDHFSSYWIIQPVFGGEISEQKNIKNVVLKRNFHNTHNHSNDLYIYTALKLFCAQLENGVALSALVPSIHFAMYSWPIFDSDHIEYLFI